jgi:hypothetical protein
MESTLIKNGDRTQPAPKELIDDFNKSYQRFLIIKESHKNQIPIKIKEDYNI